MTNARDKANIPVLNFQSKGIDDNADATAITIDSSERVGIGTASPYSILGGGSLSVHNSSGGSELNLLSSTTGYGALYFGDATSGNSRYAGYIEYKHDDDYFRFATNSTERMRLNSTGLGIGTSSPSTSIHISSNTPILTFEETDQSNRKFQIGSFGNAYAIYDATNTQYRYILDNSGNHIFNEGSQDCDFRVESNGNANMLFVDGGNDRVGIGTSSPSTRLEVSGSSDNLIKSQSTTSTSVGGYRALNNGSTEIKLFAYGSAYSGTTFGGVANANLALLELQGASNVVFSTWSNAGGSNPDFIFAPQRSQKLIIKSDGKVGIGTSSPATPLHIVTTDGGNVDESLTITNASTTSGTGSRIRFVSSTDISSTPNSVSISSYRNAGSNHDLLFESSNAEKMRITSAGSVGIGTSSPTLAKLHVKSSDSGVTSLNGASDEFLIESSGSTGMTIASGTTEVGRIAFADSGNNLIGNVQYDHGNDSMTFKVNNSERIRINSNGLVLAGTTSPVNLGHTFKAIADSSLYFALSAEDHATGDAAIRGILSFASGNNGSSGTGYLFVGRTSDGDKFFVRSDGDCQNTNNSYGAISDRQLKENEVDASSQWDDIKSIQVKNYNLKSLPDKTHLGVIAQDLEASGMNGLVKTDEDGTKSVKYSILYMKSVKALQEAMTRIESLEAEVTALKNQP